MYLTFDFSSSFHHAVCFFLLTDVHLNPTVFSMLLFIKAFRLLRCFSTSSSSSVVVSLFFWVICSLNSFLMFSPFARLCKLIRFFFSAGFSLLMVCLVCITTSRWSESSETHGIANHSVAHPCIPSYDNHSVAHIPASRAMIIIQLHIPASRAIGISKLFCRGKSK